MTCCPFPDPSSAVVAAAAAVVVVVAAVVAESEPGKKWRMYNDVFRRYLISLMECFY